MNSVADLPKSELYPLIQTRPLRLSERALIDCLKEARLDPRLMEICTEFLRDYWWNLHPILLNQAAKRSSFPYMLRAALIVILKSCEATETTRQAFTRFVLRASVGIANPAPQFLYSGIHRIGSKLNDHVIQHTPPAWKEMNLFEDSLPFNKGKPGKIKSRSDYGDNIALTKADLAMRFKEKKAQGFSKEEIISLTGVNRVFLSKILNHDLDGITLDYLVRRAGVLSRTAQVPVGRTKSLS